MLAAMEERLGPEVVARLAEHSLNSDNPNRTRAAELRAELESRWAEADAGGPNRKWPKDRLRCGPPRSALRITAPSSSILLSSFACNDIRRLLP